MIEWQRTLAEKYGMILLVHEATSIPVAGVDTLLQQTLHKYPIDPDKIALTGDWIAQGCADPKVFSRVALLSPDIDGRGIPVCAEEGRRPRAVRVYVAGGLGEPGFVPQTLWSARYLRAAGHDLEAVLALRGYGAGPDDFERMWRWISESWTSEAPATPPPTPPAAVDSGPLLTARALNQLTTFWNRFMREPDSIRITARLAHQQQITVPVATVRFTILMMDTPALAARYPSIRTALAAAGLTARQADAYRQALISAVANHPLWPLRSPMPPVPAGTRLGQNVAFLQALQHKDALKVLGATGMWITP